MGGRGAGGEGGRATPSALNAKSRLVRDRFGKGAHIRGLAFDVVAHDVETRCSKLAFACFVLRFPMLLRRDTIAKA